MSENMKGADTAMTIEEKEKTGDIEVNQNLETLNKIAIPVVDWYKKNKRDLPWRHNPDAYRVWVSEIMLQQTRVEAVKGYYDRFFAKYPRLRRYAVCYEHQIEETLPTGCYDIYMHDIYTEREVIQCFWGSEALLES